MSKFNNLSLQELKDVLIDYNIDETTIPGTGKNGRVLKTDIINAIDNYLTREDIYDPRQSIKKKTKTVSKTAGLKTGDWVLYRDNEGLEFKAIVETVTASTKADIRPTRYLNPEINPNIVINANRKFLTIIEPENVVRKDVVITIGDGEKTATFAVKSDNPEEFDKIQDAIILLFNTNGIVFEQI